MKNSPLKAILGLCRSTLLGLLLLGSILPLTGCGGNDTKIYSAQKTVVFGDSIYNVTDVGVYQSRFEAQISDTQTINLRGMEKKALNALLDEHESLNVKVFFSFDDLDVLYHQETIDSWGDFKDINKKIDRGDEDLREFLADAEETQLELD